MSDFSDDNDKSSMQMVKATGDNMRKFIEGCEGKVIPLVIRPELALVENIPPLYKLAIVICDAWLDMRCQQPDRHFQCSCCGKKVDPSQDMDELGGMFLLLPTDADPGKGAMIFGLCDECCDTKGDEEIRKASSDRMGLNVKEIGRITVSEMNERAKAHIDAALERMNETPEEDNIEAIRTIRDNAPKDSVAFEFSDKIVKLRERLDKAEISASQYVDQLTDIIAEQRKNFPPEAEVEQAQAAIEEEVVHEDAVNLLVRG